jgi:phosphopantothenoylcysteine decarboxylase/phosphopantothenate--cysteine ligase
MYEAVHQHKNADIIIMAAAVSDFTPSRPATEKIKKNGNLSSLPLKATQDILASLGEQKRDGQILVGFAMETEHGVENALIKLKKKNLNWIVLNNLKESGAGFGTTTNKVTLFNADGHAEDLPIMPKLDVAEAILDRIT